MICGAEFMDERWWLQRDACSLLYWITLMLLAWL